MEALITHTGRVMPMDRSNVDTDAIIPKQYLKSIKRTGFGAFLFDEWRFKDPGTLDSSPEDRTENAEFVLNQPAFRGSSIALARRNFGCGSSREHAPWALMDFGFKAIIAPSFADIFYNNCFKNSMLPVTLPRDQIELLLADAKAGKDVEVDLPSQKVIRSDGTSFAFEVHWEPYEPWDLGALKPRTLIPDI